MPPSGTTPQRQSSSSILWWGSKIVPAAALEETSEAKEWEEDKTADRASREVIKARFVDPGPYTPYEEKCFDVALRMESNVSSSSSSGGAATTTLLRTAATKSRSSMLLASTAGVNGVLHGRSVCRIRATAVDVLAFLLDNDSKIKTKYDVGSSTISQKTLEVVNGHHSVIFLLGRAIPPFQNREFVGTVLWRKEEHSDDYEKKQHYFYVYVPTVHELAPLSSNCVRAEAVRAFRLVEESPGVTTCTYTFTVDMMGRFPDSFTNRVVIPSNLESPYRPHKYFALIKSASDFDDKGQDAATLAEHLTDDFFSHNTDAHRKLVFPRYVVRAAALRSVGGKYPAVRHIFFGMLSGKVSLASESKTKVHAMTEVIALEIGRALSGCLMDNSSVEAGVEQWIEQNDAVGELVDEFPYLRQMFLTIAMRKMKRVMWGLIMRVGLGAFLSFLDMTTDMYSINMFIKNNQTGFAYATLLMIGLNMIIQMLLVFAQNRRQGAAVVLREFLIVLSCFKPGIDAYRVCTGAESEVGATVTPMMEMMASKMVEVVLEALP